MNIDILEHTEIVNHLKQHSAIFKLNNQSDWIQVLCSYCDDAHRKTNIRHGHFYISRYFNFSQCFRCEKRISTKRFLLDIGFDNKQLLNNLFKNNITLSSDYKLNHNNNKVDIINIHKNFQRQYPKQYSKFIDYIKYRLNDVDFELFKLYPLFKNNKLSVGFNNYYNNFSTLRFIEKNEIKYFKESNSQKYFFNNPLNYNNIIITEGVFDLINLYKYSTIFDKGFYVALNGRSYISDIYKLISNYYMIGHFTFHIVFDADVKNLEILTKNIINKNNILNPMIKYKFYKPTISKDVSDLNLIQFIGS